MSKFVAIDPGTYYTGVAVFQDKSLEVWTLIAPESVEVDQRIREIVEKLTDYLFEDKGYKPKDIAEVAIERPQGVGQYRPAPELDVLVRRLRRWATRPPHRWKWHMYHPSSVLSSVRPRQLHVNSKDLIRIGVTALYPQLQKDLIQDVYDAVAVGHCHLVKSQAAAMEKL